MIARSKDVHGRRAERPSQIPARGWRDVGTRIARQQGLDNLSIVAAGVAFYTLLAVFPALTAAVSVYALAADPAQVEQQIQSLAQLLPGAAHNLIAGQISRVVATSGGALGVGVIGGILVAFWSASKGTKSLLTALNIAYGETEDRGLIRFNAIALGLTVALILGGLLTVALVVVLPIVLSALGLGAIAATAVSLARWVLLAAGVIVGLAVLYRFGPSRRAAQWRWVTPGSLTATILWLITSILFSIYVSNFGSYNATYGALGAVIILLLWLQLSAYIVLLGAEINSEIERQTREDSTGQRAALGERRATAADTVGEGRDSR